MPRLSRVQEEGRRRLAALAGGGLLPEAFGGQALAALDATVPTEGARLLGIDPATLLVNRTLAASANDGWARRSWLRDAYLASGDLAYIDFPYLMRANLMAVALHERQDECWGYAPEHFGAVTAREHRRTYHETGAPVGGTLLISIPAGDRWVAALQLYRRDPSWPFSRGDVAFLRLVAPLLGQGLGTALARERALVANGATPDSPGIVVLDPDGGVRFSTPAGDAWSALLRDAARESSADLPTALRAAAATLRPGAPAPIGRALTAPTAAGLVRLDASPADAAGAVAVVLTPVAPPPPPEVPLDWPLTPAERQIVALLLHGQSNAQLAARLCLSENTIQTHLRHAYGKLGVGNRNQLLARLFHETYWPTLQTTDATLIAD